MFRWTDRQTGHVYVCHPPVRRGSERERRLHGVDGREAGDPMRLGGVVGYFRDKAIRPESLEPLDVVGQVQLLAQISVHVQSRPRSL